MKTIVNKELDVELVELRQSAETNQFVQVPQTRKTSFGDLLVQLAKQPKGQEGLGDLEEQMARMEIIKRAKTAEVGADITLEEAEVAILKGNLAFFNVVLLDEGLIEFQKLIKEA